VKRRALRLARDMAQAVRISKGASPTQCDGNQHLRLGFGARPVCSLSDTRAVHAARGFDEVVVAKELPLRAKLVPMG
jgi:hypothetical protein